MKPATRDVLLDFRTRFEQSGGDLRIDAYLRERGLTDDDALADLIEADARLRRRRGDRVRLEDYLSAVPDLATRTIPLDAALEASLRAAIDDGATTVEAVERLSAAHPALRTLIQEAAVLGRLLPTATIDGDAADSGPTFHPGDEIGEPMEDGRRRYLVRERLGAGVQGEVHLAVDRRLTGDAGESLVAIKALRRNGDDEARRRFLEEAARARRIDHPNVVRVIDRGVHEGRDYIVFDYIAGGALDAHARARGGRLPLREAARILASVARGVQAAHAAGLVHGDLKPGNILLTEGGEAKVADFGVAALLRSDGDESAPEGLQGNLAFMAPEQFRMDARARSPLADVYALGGMLFWLASGRFPRGDSIAEILASHRTDDRPAREGDLDDVDLDLIARRALSHDPGDRQPAAGAFADDLDAWLERLPIRWTRPPLSHVLRLWLRRRPWTAAAVLALVAAFITTGALALRFRSVAGEATRRQRIADESLAAELANRERIEQWLIAMVASGELMEQMRFTTADLYELWLFELVGRDILGDASGVMEAHAVTRRAFLERHIEEAVQEGAVLRPAMLRWALGSFMLEDGDFSLALDTLAAADSMLAGMLPAQDPAVVAVRCLMAAAEAHLISSADGERLRELERLLVGGLSRYEPRSPLRGVLVSALERLYAPDMLDRPDSLTALREPAGDIAAR